MAKEQALRRIAQKLPAEEIEAVAAALNVSRACDDCGKPLDPARIGDHVEYMWTCRMVVCFACAGICYP